MNKNSYNSIAKKKEKKRKKLKMGKGSELTLLKRKYIERSTGI